MRRLSQACNTVTPARHEQQLLTQSIHFLKKCKSVAVTNFQWGKLTATVWWAWHNKDKTCRAARLKQVYRLCVRVQEKRRSICPGVCGNKASLPSSPEMAPHRESRNPPVMGRREGLSSLLLRGKASMCVVHMCASKLSTAASSWHCVASIGGSRGERRLRQFVAASGCHRACDVLSLLQAGREGARCEKGQRERRQPASWGGLGKTCGQLQAVPTLGCTPSSSAAGWCPLRRRTQTGCSLCLLHM